MAVVFASVYLIATLWYFGVATPLNLAPSIGRILGTPQPVTDAVYLFLTFGLTVLSFLCRAKRCVRRDTLADSNRVIRADPVVHVPVQTVFL